MNTTTKIILGAAVVTGTGIIIGTHLDLPALRALLVTPPAVSQVAEPELKPWDEPGPGKTNVRIKRTQEGLTLGEPENASYRDAPNHWRGVALEGTFGRIVYQALAPRLPAHVTEQSVIFYEGKLDTIISTYVERSLGGWETLLRVTGEKYGPPALSKGDTSAVWSDGRTSLGLTKDFRRGVIVILIDVHSIARYLARIEKAAPRF